MSDGTQAGRTSEVSFALVDPATVTDPAAETYLELGMLRDRSLNSTVGDIDVTADKTAGDYRDYIDNYKEGTFDFSGICYGDTEYNQKVLWNHIHITPAPGTNDKVVGYIKITQPVWDQVLYIPVKFDSANFNAAYDGTQDFQIAGKYAGAPTKVDVTP